MAQRREFGWLRRLPSKRYQASYLGPDGERHLAHVTFTARSDAEAWLASERVLIERGDWGAPETRNRRLRAPRLTLGNYAEQWLERSHARPSTLMLYGRLLRLHILPELGARRLSGLDRVAVDDWWRALDHSKARTCDLAYSLLRTICYAAVDEELLMTNPCRVKGAGRPARRRSMTPLTPDAIAKVAAQMPAEWSIGVLLGAWLALRSGEVRELRRLDVDLSRRVVHVRRAVTRGVTGLIVGEPKTDAGRRSVLIPSALIEPLTTHLGEFAQPGDDGLLIWSRATGGHVHDGAWTRAWRRAAASCGLEEYHFHDLRHAGLTHAAGSGATVRELQLLAGHTTAAMALWYQEIADTHMSEVVGRLSEMIQSDTHSRT